MRIHFVPSPRLRGTSLSVSLAAALGLGALATGCAHRPPPEERGGPPEAMLERVKSAPPLMRGELAFFDGELVVTATTSRGFSGGRGGGPRGGGGDGPGGGFGGGPMGGPPGGMDDGGGMRGGRLSESSAPPVRLKVEVRNTSDKPQVIEFVDCNSILGNFAVYPAKLTLQPGQTDGPDAMTSKLGMTADEIPLTLALRRNGKLERQIVMLQPLHAAEGTNK